MTDQPTETAPVVAAPADSTKTTPVPASGQPQSGTVQPRTSRARVPWWASHPPTLAAAGLILLIVELGVWYVLGWKWWLIVTGALLLLVAVLALLMGRRGRGRSARRGVTSRSGRLPRLGVRRQSSGPRAGAAASRLGSTGSRPAGGTRGGLRSRLPRMLGGTRPNRGAASTAADRSGAPGVARRGLFGRLRPGRGAGASAAGGSGRSLRQMFGRGRSGRAASQTSGGTPPRRRLLDPLRRRGRGNAASRSGAPIGTAGGSATSGRQRQGGTATGSRSGPDRRARSRWNPLTWKSRPTVGATPVRSANDQRRNQPAPKAAKPHTASEIRPGQSVPTSGSPRHRAEPAGTRPPEPAAPAASHTKGGTTMPSHRMFAEDSSLQGWGRKLRLIAPAIEETAKEDRARAAAGAATTEAITKLAAQGESDLPASRPLVAELDAIAAQMRKLDAEAAAIAERRGRLAAQAEALPAKYRSEHEMDEARLEGVRGSREREKRADVTNAEKDT